MLDREALEEHSLVLVNTVVCEKPGVSSHTALGTCTPPHAVHGTFHKSPQKFCSRIFTVEGLLPYPGWDVSRIIIDSIRAFVYSRKAGDELSYFSNKSWQDPGKTVLPLWESLRFKAIEVET